MAIHMVLEQATGTLHTPQSQPRTDIKVNIVKATPNNLFGVARMAWCATWKGDIVYTT